MKTWHFIILLNIILGVSCKKSYTCDCTTAFTYQTSPGTYDTKVYSSKKDKLSEKFTKKQAAAVCLHEKEAIETNLINGYTDNGKVPLKAGESVTTNCSLVNN